MPARLQLPVDEIKRKYLDEHLTTAQIARDYDCGLGAIRRRLREMNIPIGHRVSLRVNIPIDQLRQLYISEHLGTSKIAKIFGCDELTIRRRLDDAGIPRRKHKEYCGKYAPNWNGGRSFNHGYIQVRDPSHPRSDNRGYVLEHIKVWEQIHGKRLPERWVVHHLNGIRSDNRPSNLIGLPTEKHFVLIKAYKQRIRELEAEITQLRKALEVNQMIFYTDN